MSFCCLAYSIQKQLYFQVFLNPKFCLTAPGEAFEVSLEEDSDSIIKKHPPKRLQRLVDAPTTQTTIEELEEKLANAEIRRNQVNILSSKCDFYCRIEKYFQFLSERVNTLKTKDDESIGVDDEGSFVNHDEKSNENQNNEKHTETPTVETDNPSDVLPLTEVEVANDTTNNQIQENN